MFTREPCPGLYVLTEHSRVSTSAQVTASPQVPASTLIVGSSPAATSGWVAASCSCRSFAHPTVFWHHRLGHTLIPCLRSKASHRLVLGLPRGFASLPPLPAPPCTPCVAGRLHPTPHSSSLRLATAPFQTLHLDVWGPAPMLGPGRERFFLVVVDDYSRYTTVFPLEKKSEVTSTLIRWLLATKGTRGSCVRYLHSDSGVAERRIGLVMDIIRTSMIHARAPHFLWPYAVCYAAHQLNLQRRVSQPEASPTHLWTGSPGGVGAGGAAAAGPRTGGARSRGVGAGGASTGGASSGGARAGGADAGGASYGGAGAGGASTGGASSGGAGAGGAGAGGDGGAGGAGGASSEGTGAGSTGAGGASYGGAGAGGAGTVGASTEETRAGGINTVAPTAPPHRYDTRLQALCRLDSSSSSSPNSRSCHFAAAVSSSEWPSGLGLPSSPSVHSKSPSAYGPLFPTPDSALSVFSPPHSQSSPPVVLHDWTTRCPPRARPSSPFDDLRNVLFRSSPRCAPPVSVLPSSPESSLTVYSHPINVYYRAARPVVSLVLATLVTDLLDARHFECMLS
ncbi:unnamed protein product [Closterium sp. NIES-54]